MSFLKHTGCLSLVKTDFVSSAQIGRDGTLPFSGGTCAQLGQVRIRSFHHPGAETQKRKKQRVVTRQLSLRSSSREPVRAGEVRGVSVVTTAGFGQSPPSIQVFYGKHPDGASARLSFHAIPSKVCFEMKTFSVLF